MNLPSKYPRSEYDPWSAREGFGVQGQGHTREREGERGREGEREGERGREREREGERGIERE